MYPRLSLLLFVVGHSISIHANDIIKTDSSLQISKLPDKYLFQVQHKSEHVEHQVDKRTKKALERFSYHEKRMLARLWKVDSIAAKNIFTNSLNRLSNLKAGLKNKLPGNLSSVEYAYLDTLHNSLAFLNRSTDIQGISKDKLTSATQSVQDLESKLQQAEQVNAYIRERKQQLKDQLAQYTGFTKDLQKMNKEAYYYGQQINEYKATLKDKKKAEAKALELLKQMPAYNNFIKQHSQLAGLFNLSANSTQSLEGLQTRTQVEQMVQQRLGNSSTGQQALSQQMEQARSQFSELKSKFPELDNAGDMPDFKPNPMKTKNFLQRLEFGSNIQFQRSSKYYPTTSDIAGQVAYKLHKNGNIGLGISYKLGMGTGWNDIAFSHQGVGLRSFLDWKLKGTFFINGGFEENYLLGFTHMDQLKNWSGWKGSALVGISKKYKISAKLKGNIVLLYDFLASRNVPPTSAVKLRMGYNF